MKTHLFFLLLLLFGCLKAKKSPFDFNSPTAIIGSFAFSSQYSIGGNITGFTSSTLILQLNGGNDIILQPTTNYKGWDAFPDTSYTISIKTNPTGFACEISNATGIVRANITNVNISCNSLAVSAAYPTNGANWNDYINRDFSKDIFSQADTACNTANTGGYRTCVHAGEIRKFDFPSRLTCTNLTATDSLNAMNWLCATNSTGGITFYSSALKKGKYLSDLIDWTNNSWKPLTITITEGTSVLAVSNEITLWTNPINTTEPANPNVSGTIYLYKTNPTSIQINSTTNKVAVLLQPGTFFRFAVNNQAIQLHAKFQWIEGTLQGNSNTTGLLLNTGFSVAKNFKVQSIGISGTCSGVELSGNDGNNYLEDIVVANTNGCTNNYGILINNTSRYNFLNNISIFNILGTYSPGIFIDATSTKNTLIGVTVTNSTGSGIDLVSDDTIGLNITSVNNGLEGLSNSTGRNIILKNLLSVNNGNNGFSTSSSNLLTIENIGSFSNVNVGVYLNTSANNNYFTGVLKVGNNGNNNCYADAGTISVGMTSITCVKANLSDYNHSNASITSISTFYGVPGGSTSITDSRNITTGLNYISSIDITASGNDWLNFENFFRTIGNRGSGNFPNLTQQGICTTTCSLWDFSLKSSDATVRNSNLTGGGSGCPTAASMFTHNFTTESILVLRNSVELMNDGVGNENGLCEANEDCLLTPNIGSYQGHGSIVPASTVSGCADVTAQGIKLYQYSANGY